MGEVQNALSRLQLPSSAVEDYVEKIQFLTQAGHGGAAAHLIESVTLTRLRASLLSTALTCVLASGAGRVEWE